MKEGNLSNNIGKRVNIKTIFAILDYMEAKVKNQALTFITRRKVRLIKRLQRIVEAAGNIQALRNKRRRKWLMDRLYAFLVLPITLEEHDDEFIPEIEEGVTEALYMLCCTFLDARHNPHLAKPTQAKLRLISKWAKSGPTHERYCFAEITIATAIVHGWARLYKDPEMAFYKLCDIFCIPGEMAYNVLHKYDRCV